MKQRIKSGLLALAILLSLCAPLGGPVQQARAAEAETTSGTWGENLSWELSGTTLTVTGTGDMQEGEDVYNGSNPYDALESRSFPWAGLAFDSVVIGADVTSIAPGAFNDTTSPSTFKEITVAEGSTTFCSVGGVLFNYDQTELILYPQGRTETSYTVPETVTKIHSKAFYWCKNLTDIYLPDGLTELGEGAFSDSGLMGIHLPKALTTIGYGVFADCDSLSAIYVSSENTHFRAVDGVLFDWFPMDLPEPVALSTDEPKEAAGPTELVAYPPGKDDETYMIPESVTSIRPAAFCDNQYLQNLTVPEAVNKIDAYTFLSCTNLTTITLPNQLNYLGDYVFSCCSKLQSVTLPSKITAISDGAFFACLSLTDIVIPEGVTTIGERAFERCSALSKAVIPDSVTVIKTRAFEDCSNLADYAIPSKIEVIGSLAFAHTGYTGATLDLVIPSTIQDMGSQVFYSSNGLRSITLPATLEVIPDGFAWDCINLQKVTIPEGVSEIDYAAFQSCKSLRTLSLPKSISVIEGGVFQSSGLQVVYYAGTCAEWEKIKIYEQQNTELTNALITCTDGYYGMEDPDQPGGHNYPAIQKVEFTTRHNEGGSYSYENLLPLYTTNQTVEVRLSLENSWFDKNLNLMGFDSNGYIETFTGTVRIYGYSGTAFKVLYEKQGTDVSDCRADNDTTTSQLIFQMKASEYTKPFKADQLLFVEVLDKEGNILAYTTCRSLPIQRWSFRNYDAIVDEDIIKDILGNSKGKAVIRVNKETPLGSEGLCFGMAATASLFNSGALFATMFQNCTVLDQVQKDAKVLTLGVSTATAQELIQKMQVIQHTEVVQDELDQNYGDFDGLIQAIDDYKNGKSAMPVVWLQGREKSAGKKGGKHAICAYDSYSRTSDGIECIYLSCYDNCFPYRDCQLLIRLSDHSWELIGYDEDGYSGNSSTITYIVPSGFSGTKGQALMSAKSLGTLSTSGVKLVHIRWISNASDADTTDTADTDTDTDTGLCWLSGSGSVSASDLAGEAMSIADDYAIYTINSASAGDFALADGEVGTMTATGGNVSLSCEYYLEDENGESTLVCVTFDGASAGGSVSLTYQPESDTVALIGAGAGTVTVVYDDEDDTTDDPTWAQTVTGSDQAVSVTADGQQAPTITQPDSGTDKPEVILPVVPVAPSTDTDTDEDDGKTPFTDVPESAYSHDAVQWAVENGITTGITSTTFGPDVTCTRAQAVTFLWRAAGCPAPESAALPFTDVTPESYCYQAVQWAVENGITTGTTSTTFSPDGTCTRAQIVVLLWRGAGCPAAQTAAQFQDVAESAYYREAVLWAVENGITTGTTNTTFSPDEDCTRAQIVTFLHRAR